MSERITRVPNGSTRGAGGQFTTADGVPAGRIARWGLAGSPPHINQSPNDVQVASGQPAQFTVAADGLAPLSYQWRKDGVELLDGPAAGGGTFSGSTADTLTIDAVGAADEGEYDCAVSDACGTSISDPAALTVEAGVPNAAITGAVSRKGCDLAVTRINGAGPRSSEPREGGITELRIAFDITPGGPGTDPVTLEQGTCAAPSFAPYSGASTSSASAVGNDLVLTFAPGLENARTYRINLNSAVTSIPGQFVEVAGLIGDVNGDGFANALDRSVVVGVWTSGTPFSCSTDLNGDGATNALDRSVVVGAWTGAQNCAP